MRDPKSRALPLGDAPVSIDPRGPPGTRPVATKPSGHGPEGIAQVQLLDLVQALLGRRRGFRSGARAVRAILLGRLTGRSGRRGPAVGTAPTAGLLALPRGPGPRRPPRRRIGLARPRDPPA